MKTSTVLLLAAGVAAVGLGWWWFNRSGLSGPTTPALPPQPAAPAAKKKLRSSDFDPFNPNAKYGDAIGDLLGNAVNAWTSK